MPNPNCYGQIQAVATRVSTLAATGAPRTGANNGYSTTNVVSCDVKAEVEKGANEKVINAANNVCQIFRDCDRLDSITLTLELCALELDLVQMLIGGTSVPSPGSGIYSAAQSGKTVGYLFPNPTDACTNGVCVEFWALAWDNTTQATSNVFQASTTLTYWHYIFPRVFFQISDFKFDDKFATWKFDGIARVNPKVTANGPFDDWDAAIVNAGGVTTLGGMFLDDETPVTQCGPISVPSAAS